MARSSIADKRHPVKDFEISTNEEIFRMITENSSDAIILSDGGGRIIEWNASAERIFGIPKEGAIGQALVDLQYRALPEENRTPEMYEKIKNSLNHFYRTGDISRFSHLSEVKIRHADGSPRFIQTAGLSIKSSEGFKLCGIYRETTERKNAETSLRNSQTMLETVMDAIPTAVFWKDRDFRYLGANRNWLGAVGLKSAADVVGKSDADLPWRKEQIRSFRETDERVLESGIAQYDIIESHIRSDGIEAWTRTNKVPLRDAEGAIVGVLGTYEDITERKRMEEELFKAQKLESLGLLAGGIAHDFNNLMGGIFGFIDLALAASKDETVIKYLSSAMAGIDRARSLTGHLLTFAKGGAPIRGIRHVRPAIREAATLALSGANASCDFKFAEGLWRCIFD
jgi:two-component system, cell cycle sensor histidine kinase and response regulator CckA